MLTAAQEADRHAGRDYRPPAERMLAELLAAFQLHGLDGQVGLLDPAVFPRHRGGVGILVGLAVSERAAGRETVTWVLKSMGCDWTEDHAIGVLGHLRGGLLPAPRRWPCTSPPLIAARPVSRLRSPR